MPHLRIRHHIKSPMNKGNSIKLLAVVIVVIAALIAWNISVNINISEKYAKIVDQQKSQTHLSLAD